MGLHWAWVLSLTFIPLSHWIAVTEYTFKIKLISMCQASKFTWSDFKRSSLVRVGSGSYTGDIPKKLAVCPHCLGVAELLGSVAAAPLTSPSPIRMIASFDIMFESFSWQDWNPREHNVSFLSLEDGQRWMESTGVSLWSIESHPRMFQTPQQQRQTIKDSHHSNGDSLMNVADSSASQRGSRWKPLA